MWNRWRTYRNLCVALNVGLPFFCYFAGGWNALLGACIYILYETLFKHIAGKAHRLAHIEHQQTQMKRQMMGQDGEGEGDQN